MKMRKKHGEEGMEEEENIYSVLKWMWLFTIRPFLLISRLTELTGHSLLIVSTALDAKGAEEKGQQARAESRVISRNDRVSMLESMGWEAGCPQEKNIPQGTIQKNSIQYQVSHTGESLPPSVTDYLRMV